MLQDILVLIIIWTAVLYTIFQVVKTFIPSKNKKSTKCNGCSGCTLKTRDHVIPKTQYRHLVIKK